jgi:hypothetical protein
MKWLGPICARKANTKYEEEFVKVGQRVVFVRDVKDAEVGKRGTVMDVSDHVVVVGCTLQEHLVPVRAQMWDVLPERLWDRLLKRRRSREINGRWSRP